MSRETPAPVRWISPAWIRLHGRGLGLVVVPMIVAALLLLPSAGEFGLATRGEIPVLDRTLAALGVPRAGLERSPWLPDFLRAASFSALGERDWALRIPGLLAVICLVGLTSAWAHRLGWTRGRTAVQSLVPAAFALALPLLLASGRTSLGDATGELWISAAPLAMLEAADLSRQRSILGRVGFALLGLVLLAAAIGSRGIVIGGCLPVAIVALADGGRSPTPCFRLARPIVAVAWAAAIGMGLVGLTLGWQQGEGYIPLLASAKDLARIEDPSRGDFTASLLAFGYQTFPFVGLIVVGALAPGRLRLASLWLATALVFGSVWSLVYGPSPPPICVPAALLASAAVDRLFDPREAIASRRLILLLGMFGAMVLGKDGGRTPELIAWPLIEVPALEFPAERLDAGRRLADIADRLLLALLVAHAVALPSRDQLRVRQLRGEGAWQRRWAGFEAGLDRLLTGRRQRSGLERVRRDLPMLLVMAVLLGQAWSYGHKLLGDVGEQLGIAGPLRRWSDAVARGDIEDERLGLHRIRDPGLEFYGPGGERELFLTNRGELDKWLFDDQPRTALIRRSDLAASYSSARGHREPFYVLDDLHWDYVLVANFLPPGSVDQNPLLEIVVDEAPALANQTRVGWDYVELVGWEIEGKLHRGAEATLHMVFEVHRPLPTGTKMYARLQQGKLSRVAAEPHELGGGDYPPNYWRKGDIIHHRFEFEVPTVEVAWGEHELIVGMRKSEKSNFPITLPEGAEGEFGVRITGNKHEFAVIGVVDIAW